MYDRKPPYAERHVRWCERSENEAGGKLLHFPPTRFQTFGRVNNNNYLCTENTLKNDGEFKKEKTLAVNSRGESGEKRSHAFTE